MMRKMSEKKETEPRTVGRLQKVQDKCEGNIRKRGKRERTEEILDAGMVEGFPKSMTHTKPQTWETQRTPRRMNA